MVAITTRVRRRPHDRMTTCDGNNADRPEVQRSCRDMGSRRPGGPMKPVTILKASILVAALASLVLSISLYFAAGDEITGRLNGIFVGIWVPSILGLGAVILAASERSK